MTDQELYEDMLKRADIPYETLEKKEGTLAVIVERGYFSFYAEHVFDSDGKLIDVGAWE